MSKALNLGSGGLPWRKACCPGSITARVRPTEGGRNVPSGSVLSAQRFSRRDASVAGAARRYPHAGGVLHRWVRAEGREDIPTGQQADTRLSAVLSLARKRSRAAKRHRAVRDRLGD